MDEEEARIPVAPKQELRELERDKEYQIRTCCGQISSCDKPFCTFLAKFAISSVVLAFSMCMLIRGEGDGFYVGRPRLRCTRSNIRPRPLVLVPSGLARKKVPEKTYYDGYKQLLIVRTTRCKGAPS